jgi:hypothetical protein
VAVAGEVVVAAVPSAVALVAEAEDAGMVFLAVEAIRIRKMATALAAAAYRAL